MLRTKLSVRLRAIVYESLLRITHSQNRIRNFHLLPVKEAPLEEPPLEEPPLEEPPLEEPPLEEPPLEEPHLEELPLEETPVEEPNLKDASLWIHDLHLCTDLYIRLPLLLLTDQEGEGKFL